jgi:hypothetical protein
MRVLRFTLLGIMGAVLACSKSGPTAPVPPVARSIPPARSGLALARLRWSMAVPSDYAYVVRRSCECLPAATRPMRVVVRMSGQGPGRVEAVESVQYADDGVAVPAPYAAYAPSVAGLFDLIGEAIARDAAVVRADYDGRTGLPTRIYVDWDPQMADDEVFYEASQLERLSR